MVLRHQAIVTDEHYEAIFAGIKALGFIIKKAKNLYAHTYGYSATEMERAEDINQLANDPEVKMVFFGGGDGSIELLPYLDYEAIGRKPKIYLSYSDGTSILNAIYVKTGMVTYYGQAPGQYAEVSEYDYQQFVDFCMKQDVKEMKHKSEWKTLNSGKASGILIGGYLLNFALLLGSAEYQPDLTKEYILFLEDSEYFFGVPYVSALLANIEQSSFMPRVRGLLFGNYSVQPNPDLYGRLTRIGTRWNIPVCYCDDFGHGCNNGILAIGAHATLDADIQKLIYD